LYQKFAGIASFYFLVMLVRHFRIDTEQPKSLYL